jgi:hypothetical protein
METEQSGTVVPAWWLNAVQEELLTVIASGGIPFSKVDYNQLYLSIMEIIATHASVTAARAKADQGFALAAIADSKADAAQFSADSAQVSADQGIDDAATAQATAEQAIVDAGEAQATAADAEERGNNALGLLKNIDDVFDATGEFQNPAFLLLTNPTDTNLPSGITYPVYFRNILDDGGTSVYQMAWDSVNTYARAGTIAGDAATFGYWVKVPTPNDVASALADAKAYTDGEIDKLPRTFKDSGEFLAFYQSAPTEVSGPVANSRALKQDGTAIATYNGSAWAIVSLDPEPLDLYFCLSDSTEYYWAHGLWNRLDFDTDMTTKEDVANKTTTLAGTAAAASDTKYPSEKAVVSALVNVSGTIPNISGKQDKLSGTSGNVVTYTATAGATGTLEVDTTVTASSANLITSGGVATAISGFAPTLTRLDYTASSALASGATVTTPSYKVGGGRLMVFWNGLLVRAGASAQYQEVGSAGATSTSISLPTGCLASTELTFLVI